MKSTFRFSGALVTALTSILFVSGSSAEEPKEIPIAKPVSTTEPVPVAVPVPSAKPVSSVEVVPLVKPAPSAEMLLPADGVLPVKGDSASINSAEADRNEDGELSERELAQQDHRKQLEIYDLNDDKMISKDEWKAANKKDEKRAEKFFLIDKDENGEIDENEAFRFLKERISVDSTYVDATGEGPKDTTKPEISENAPSEVRFTLFSIPIGD